MIQLSDATVIGLLDAAPEAIVVTDVEGRIALVNESAEQLFGYARVDLVGQLIEVLVADSLRQSHTSLRGDYARNPRARPMGLGIKLAGRRQDGTEFPAEILEARGFHVLVAAHGQEAVDLARDHAGRIDLLLTDVIMPGMGGKEVADRVTAARPGARVAFMSGYAESVMTAQGRIDAGVEIIAKPFSRAALIERINEILSAP